MGRLLRLLRPRTHDRDARLAARARPREGAHPRPPIARRTAMSRIEGVNPNDAGPLTGLVLRLARRETKKLTGRETEGMIGPLEAYAHAPRLLFGYGMLEGATA